MHHEDRGGRTDCLMQQSPIGTYLIILQYSEIRYHNEVIGTRESMNYT